MANAFINDPWLFVQELRNRTDAASRRQCLQDAHEVDQQEGKAFGDGRVFEALQNCVAQYLATKERGNTTVANIFSDVSVYIIDIFPDAVIDSERARRPTRGKNRNTVLHSAARSQCGDVVKCVLRRLASETDDIRWNVLQFHNEDGKTALALAVDCLDKDIVRALLDADNTLAESMASPLHMVLRALSVSDINPTRLDANIDNAIEVINLFVEKSSVGVLDRIDPDGKSPFVKAQQYERIAADDDMTAAFGRVRTRLKWHVFESYYGKRDLLEKALYSGSEGKILELDLSDFDYHNSTLSVADFTTWLEPFQRFHDRFNFDDWLTGLRLPDMSWEQVPLDMRHGLEDQYEKLMTTLADSPQNGGFGVSRIWKLVVKDSERYPISDHFISEWVQRFKVVELDWWKLDLDISRLTTAQPRPHLKRIKLYSSCNWQPIFFWTSSDGLIRLPRLREAEIQLVQLNRLSTSEVLTIKTKTETRLSRLPNQRLRIIVTRGDVHPPPTVNSPSNKTPMQRFYHNLEPVQTFFQNPQSNLPRIKIAILDVGVDAWQGTVRDNIASGVSLLRFDDPENRMTPWFTASHPHGTYMAHLISTVNPIYDLYSYRVGTYRTDIDLRVAVTAIKDAVAKDVDIISCSWSTSEDNPDFNRAIHEAGGQTLIFGAGADEPYSLNGPYPAAYLNAIHVAAATARGRNRIETYSPVDLLVLGENVQVRGPKYLPTSEQETSGSSVATALAAGLASLLLAYCQKYSDGTSSWREYRRKENMLRLFKLMQPGRNDGTVYVDPGFLFRNNLRFTRDGKPTREIEQCFRSVESLKQWLR